VRLSVDRDTLLVRDGLTHAEHEPESYRFFRGDPARPPRIVMLDGTGSLSFDVLSWLAQHDIALFKVDFQGELVSVVAGRHAYDPERVSWQIRTRADPEARLAFAQTLIASKLIASLETLSSAVPKSRARDGALSAVERELSAIEAGEMRDVDALRLAEARAASAYFQAWKSVAIHWRAKWRRLVPEDWNSVGSRRSMRSPSATNRNATHPVNAMLNYAYAVLHSAVQIEVLGEGYDPHRGIMHESRADAAAMILDFVEPRRPVVDRAVLRFVSAHQFSGSDFTITERGVCRLNPALAKKVALLV
jgi:CRISPR-associated endonuclease Cas1